MILASRRHWIRATLFIQILYSLVKKIAYFILRFLVPFPHCADCALLESCFHFSLFAILPDELEHDQED